LEKVVVLVILSTTKLSLLFLDFSTMFNRFYKFQLKHIKEERIYLLLAPWKFSKDHREVPGLHKTPRRYWNPYNATLGDWGRRGRWNSGDLAGGLGRGSGSGGSRG
jgi:hypothetical protein